MRSRLFAAAVGVLALLAVLAPVAATTAAPRPAAPLQPSDAPQRDVARRPAIGPTAPDALAPGALAPDAPAPGALAPDALAPDALAPDAPTLPGAPDARAPGPAPDARACLESELEFARRRYAERRGDVARVAVLFVDAFADDSIGVYVRGDDDGYEAHVEVSDGNGDGRVTVLFDTATAGSGRPAETLRAAAPADEVLERDETALDGPLATGAYDFRAWGPGCAQSYADLVVEERRPVAVAAYRGDRSLLANLTSPAAVRTALDVGGLSRTYDGEGLAEREGLSDEATQLDRAGTPVLRGETLALAVEAPALADDLASTEGSATAALRARLGDDVAVRAVEDSVDGDEAAERYDLSDLGDWRAVPDVGNDTVYLLADTRAPYEPDAGDDSASEDADYGRVGERYVVAVETEGGSDATAFEFAPPAAALDTSDVGDVVVLPATAGATVAGTADLPDGATVSVTLRSPAGDRFPVTRPSTVADGRFAAAFDLAGVPRRATFEAVVRHGGARVAVASGRVEAAAEVEFVTATRRVSRPTVEQVSADEVALTDGGFVVVRRGSADGPVLGTSGYLPPGDHTGVPVRFDEPLDADGTATLVAVVHHDDDGDGEFEPAVDAVYDGGSPTATLRLVDETPTATPPPTASPTPTTPGPETRAATPPTGDGIPGPGPAVALGGVVVAALALARRGRGDR